AFGAHHVDRTLDEVPYHGLDVSSDVADLGELGGLHLDERSSGKLREAARDFGLADARRSNEDDVVRSDLVPQPLGRTLAAPPVAKGDGDRLLRVRLSYDVAIQLGHDLTRCQVGELGECLLCSGAGHGTTENERSGCGITDGDAGTAAGIVMHSRFAPPGPQTRTSLRRRL